MKTHAYTDLRRILLKKQMEVCIFLRITSEEIGNSLQRTRKTKQLTGGLSVSEKIQIVKEVKSYCKNIYLIVLH